MKKTFMTRCGIAVLAVMVLTLASCKSKEEKIAEVIELLDQEKYTEGLALYQEMEEVQDTMLLNKLAYLYANGTGVEQDSVKALELFAKSAEQGNPKAMVELGLAYEMAKGGYKKDDKKAFEWYKKAAEMEWPAGIRNMARNYRDGIGTEKNPEKAVELFKKAIDLGDAQSMNHLGVMYWEGNGVFVNMDEAIKYLNMAADKNHVGALTNLGYIYSGDGKGAERIAFEIVNL